MSIHLCKTTFFATYGGQTKCKQQCWIQVWIILKCSSCRVRHHVPWVGCSMSSFHVVFLSLFRFTCMRCLSVLEVVPAISMIGSKGSWWILVREPLGDCSRPAKHFETTAVQEWKEEENERNAQEQTVAFYSYVCLFFFLLYGYMLLWSQMHTSFSTLFCYFNETVGIFARVLSTHRNIFLRHVALVLEFFNFLVSISTYMPLQNLAVLQGC